jgi:ATP-dependent DNA helicase DinG
MLGTFVINHGTTLIRSHLKFCTKCGARVKQAPGGGPAKFCTKCGAQLAQEAPRKPRLVESFPFKAMRPQQKEILEQVEQAISQSKRFIILEAPVGFGKSAIAASLGRHLGSAYLLTSTKQLQDQYSADFGFPVVIGKSNFTCLVPTSSGQHLPCSKGRCEVDWKLSECPHYLTFEEYEEHRLGACRRDSKCERLEDDKLCYYYAQKWDAFRAPVMVANYPFFLTELRYTQDIMRRRLLVCDEAHDLEKQMVGFASFSLKKSQLETYRKKEDKPDVVTIPDKGEEASAWMEPLIEARKTLELFVGDHIEDDTMQDRVAACKNALESLKGFLEDLEASPSNWVVNNIRKSSDGSSVEEVVFQPLEIGAYTGRLFESADTILFMSATVFSKETYCRTLGIPQEEAAFIRVKESSFPVENRMIYALGTARLNKNSIDANLGLIAQVVDEIMTRHAGERGIVHTTSYQQARYIMGHVSALNRGRLASTEGVSSRSTLLKVHGSSDESVLISPSLYQGVDLKDELSRFQVLVKVPYPDLSERRTKIKLNRDPGWYDWQTALRMVQTYGRSVRCFDRETEILTTSGWKDWKSLEVGDVAYGVEPKAFELGRRPLRWGRVPVLPNPVLAVNRGGDPEETISIRTNCVDIVVTPDHTILAQTRKTSFLSQTTRRNGRSWTYSTPYLQKSASLLKIQARNLPARFKVPCAGWAKGRRGGTRLEDDWFWLIGFIIGDGSISPTKNEVTIFQSWFPLKRKNAMKIGRVLRRLGLRFRYYERDEPGLAFGYERNGPNGSWVLSGFDSARVRDVFDRGFRRRYSKKVTFRKAKHRLVDGWKRPVCTIPRWVLERASPSQMLKLLEGLMASDGSSRSPSKRSKDHVNGQYWTSNRALADKLQEMLALCGFRSTISVHRAAKGKEELCVGFLNPATTDVTRSSCVRPGPKVPVWCPSTRLGTVIVRRNGMTFIAGNSETDHAVTYVLDSNFAWFLTKHKELFPEYFLEAIRPGADIEK